MQRSRADRLRRIRRHIIALGSQDRAEAIRSRGCLARYYGSDALPSLIEARSDPDALRRCTVAMTLGDIHAPGSFEALAPMSNDEVAYVRYDACIALGNLGDTRAIPLLERQILREWNGPDWLEAVQGAAFQGLCALGDEAVDSLRRLSDCGDHEVAVVVPGALAQIGTPRAVALLESLRSHASAEVRAAVEEEAPAEPPRKTSAQNAEFEPGS